MSAPDASRSIAHYAELARGYDRSCRLVMPLRHEAVAALRLEPGQSVLDVACGTGLSLPLLADRVGRQGRVVGVEHSPAMMDLARARADELRCAEVTLLEESVEAAPLPPRSLDAVLFHFTHDVLQSPAAIRNVLSALRPGARVVVAGTKLTSWWFAPVNLWVLWRARRYLTTYAGLDAPWRLLAPHVPDLQIAPRLFDTAYLGAGAFAGYPEPAPAGPVPFSRDGGTS